MRNKKSAILLLSLIVASLSLKAQDSTSDLIKRVQSVDPIAYKMAVDDMMKLTKNKFEAPSNWSDALTKITAERAQIVAGLSRGDKATIAKTRALLEQLDKTLLANPLLEGKELLVIRRYFEQGDRSRTGGGLGLAPTNYQNNSEIRKPKGGWHNDYLSLSGFGAEVKESIAYTPPKGMIISDSEPHFSGEKVMFSSIGTFDRWHLFELDLKTKAVQQITPVVYQDFDSFDGCYTPDGRYVFCATATFLGLPCTDGQNKMCGLFIYDPKTGKTRQLTFDQDSNWGPTVLNNGQIMYQRWEYADLPHSNSRYIFSMNPDGTSQSAYYGSGSYFPAAFFGTRAIPGHSSAIVGIAGGHHSVSRGGSLLVVDPAQARKGVEGVLAEIPYRGRAVEDRVRDRQPDGVWPQFLHPFPLNDTYFLASIKRTPSSLWGVCLVDRFNNITLIKEQQGAAILEPVVVAKTIVPPTIPDRIDLEKHTATVFLQDVYFGGGLKNIPRGTVKKLRIGSHGFSPLMQGGLLGAIGLDGPWDIKIIHGEVDVEADGSAIFEVPANTPIFVQPLDSEGKALQVMRSWFTAMNGETLSCIGCHEDANSMPIPKSTIASKKTPQQIKPFFEQKRGLSFRHEVQPILDAKCVMCHDGKPDRPYLKGDKMVTDWSSQIGGNAGGAGGHFTESYYQLQRYVRRPGIESDIAMLEPMDVHADQTELMHILNKGHYGVKVSQEEMRRIACWIDYNAPFFGRRSEMKNYEKTLPSYALRAKYLPLFGLEAENLEWLPELKTNIAPVQPERLPEITGEIDTLNGWPHYQGRNVNRHEASTQVALGDFHKSVTIGGGIKIELVKVPAGSFVMGSKSNRDERPVSVQKIEKPFWIGCFEITNEQFAQFDPQHDSRTEHRHGYQFGRRGYPLNKGQQPVVRVSWQQAMAYCKWLSEKTGLKVTLPTEAEWEWACRAGSDTPYYFGQMGDNYVKYANMGDISLKEFASCSSFKFYDGVRVVDNPSRYDDWVPRDSLYDDLKLVSDYVGERRANSFGIHDMHGNVNEWTLSAYKPYPYNANDGRNDIATTQKRVARGGSWYDRPFKNTSSYRSFYAPYQPVFNVGFRVVVQE